MARRKKEKHEEHIDESWLIPYADILTLLLALFIVLFSMSSIDAQKFQQLSKVFNGIFTSGTGVLEYQNPLPEDQITPVEDELNKDKEKEEELKDKKELEEIQKKINQFINERGLSNDLQTSLTDEGLLVRIKDSVLFEPGSAVVREQYLGVAREISELLVIEPPRNIIISGHTDNVPINNAQFESNWELSVIRAVNFLKIILENDDLDTKWFSAKGYGEFSPIATNETAEGRGKNRRVEILILPRTEN